MANKNCFTAESILPGNIFYFAEEKKLSSESKHIFHSKVKKIAAIKLEKCKKKSQIIFKPIPWSMKKRAWINKASKTQRRLGIVFSPILNFVKHGAFVSLWLFYMNINPKAQSKKTSVVKKENLSLKFHYAYDSFVPSVFFICPKKITGPKRLKAHASQRSDNPLCIYSFGAFFQTPYKSLPIKSRRGAGAILKHVTSSCFHGCLTFVTKKSAIACCTSAVFFFFLFFAIYECLIHTKKNSKWREYVST